MATDTTDQRCNGASDRISRVGLSTFTYRTPYRWQFDNHGDFAQRNRSQFEINNKPLDGYCIVVFKIETLTMDARDLDVYAVTNMNSICSERVQILFDRIEVQNLKVFDQI